MTMVDDDDTASCLADDWGEGRGEKKGGRIESERTDGKRENERKKGREEEEEEEEEEEGEGEEEEEKEEETSCIIWKGPFFK